MLFTRNKISGIDVNIDGLQRALYPKLVSLWGLNAQSNTDYNSHARAYRNQTKDDGFVPEIYTDGGEYKEVYVDDRIKALSFFTVSDTVDFSDNLLKADVSLIFFVDLSKIAPGEDRNDEVVRQQVIRLVQGKRWFNFSFTGVQTGIESVFREFSGLRRSVGVKYRDMYPFHCFRINFSVTYKSNC